MKAAVVGHVERIDFVRVERVPAPGEIVTALEGWSEAAGGGAMAALEFLRLGAETTFFTAVGSDELGARAVRELHMPLLVIQGRNDRLQPPRQSQLLFEAANEPKSHEVVATGHLPHLEAPGVLARLLIGWASDLDRSP